MLALQNPEGCRSVCRLGSGLFEGERDSGKKQAQSDRFVQSTHHNSPLLTRLRICRSPPPS